MGFAAGLSGLNASNKRMDVIGHNIANANTIGMKVSRAEYSELIGASLGVGGGADGGSANGIGVTVGKVTQQFTQGTIDITGNSLDVAVNGAGFFQIQQTDGSKAFTRDGQFKLDKAGNIVTNGGANVLGLETNVDGVTISRTAKPMKVPNGQPLAAKATTTISAEFNLDASSKVGATAVPVIPIGAAGTSLTAYDSEGIPITVSLSFDKTNNDNWVVYAPNPSYIAPDPITLLPATIATVTTTDNLGVTTTNADGTTNTEHLFIGTMTFDATGKLQATKDKAGVDTAVLGKMDIDLYSSNPNVNLLSVPPGQFPATLDMTKATQYGNPFAVSALSQNGYTAGDLSNVSITDAGILTAQYSNGETQPLFQVAMADFRNVQGLQPIGGGRWLETFSSGIPKEGTPGTGNFGVLRTGALESSNVDLTAELIYMMTAQRDYQANAQTIKTQDQVLSTLVNLR